MSDFALALTAPSDAATIECGFGSSQNSVAAERTAGALLREARESAGLHIAALAASLKIPVKKLEALEQDRLDLLPDAVFARALASSMCRTLKVDATQVLERLPPSCPPRLNDQGSGINRPFRSSGGATRLPMWKQVSRPAVFTGIAFLLGALVLIFLPASKPDTAFRKSDAGRVLVGVDPMKPATVASASPANAGILPAAAERPAPVSVSVSAPEISTAALSGPALADHPVVQGGTTDLVTFRAKGESWVEVTDAKGMVVLRRILAAGELASASGALPLTAVVGRADATQVKVRGQVFDLSALAKNNVARFEVK